MNKDIEGVVLAGGKGKRLSPLTDNIPKSLLTLNNKKLIEYCTDAFQKATIDTITIVTSEKGKFINYLRGNYCFIETAGVENIFFVFMQVVPTLQKEYAVFVDGDSIFSSLILNNLLKRVSRKFDLLIAVSTSSSSSSQWHLETQDGILTNLLRNESSDPHYAIIIKTSTARKLYNIINNRYNLANYKYENMFLPSYEQYFLGWGLIIKLYLDNGFSVFCDRADVFFKNINSASDIAEIEGHDFDASENNCNYI